MKKRYNEEQIIKPIMEYEACARVDDIFGYWVFHPVL